MIDQYFLNNVTEKTGKLGDSHEWRNLEQVKEKRPNLQINKGRVGL
jgi:hypothetical protein